MATNLWEWILRNETILQQLGIASLLLLVITLAVLPLVVIHLPVDYFTKKKRESAARSWRGSVLWVALAVVKNLAGLMLVLAGVAMLVLPGQGLLTILVGIALTNFPGKFALERRIAGRPGVGKALNAVRKLAGRPPLRMPKTPPREPRKEP
jgi:hypothetical protein